MRWAQRIRMRLRALFRRAAVEAELDEELRYHVEREAEERVRRGAEPAAARRDAALAFGGMERFKEECREARGVRFLDELRQDVRYGARAARRVPGFALVVVAILALGIGLTSALCAAFYGVLLRPLPYGNAARAMVLWQSDRSTGAQREGFSPANFLDVRERTRAFDAVAAAEEHSLDRIGPDGPESVRSWAVSEGFFEVLGTVPLLGRTFRPGEHVAGNERVVVLGERYWRRRFGGDPGLVGRTLVLDGAPYLVAGVVRASFRFPSEAHAWVPRVTTERDPQRRAAAYLDVVARRAPGVSAAAAQAELDAIMAELAAAHPRINGTIGIVAVELPEQVLGAVRPVLLVLLGAVALLLLVACSNVANLFLARTTGRGREFALRLALGAERGRVTRQLLTEGALLALAAGLAGVALARLGVEAIRKLAPADVPRVDEIALDPRVVAFTLAVSVLTALGFAAIPAWRAGRLDAREELRASGARSTAGPRRRRVRGALVIAEVALSFVLVVGAGLLLRSFVALTRTDPGYRSDGVAVASLFLWGHFDEPARQAGFVRDATARLAALPGVRAVGVSTALPLLDPVGREDVDIVPEGRPVPAAGEEPTVHGVLVTPGFFDALRIPLRRGRLLTDADDARGRPVAVVSEGLARRYYEGVDPVGKRIGVKFSRDVVPHEIVGVVGDVRRTGLDEIPRPTLYLPYFQAPTGSLVVSVRTDGDAPALTRRIAERIWSVAPALPLSTTATLDDLRRSSLRVRQFVLALLGAFALSALALAALGVYGLLSGATAEREREIGVRLALGAQGRDVLARVLRDGAALALVGLAIGGVAAAGGTRLLRSLLFAVTPLDAPTFLAAAAVILAVSVVAALVPAWRAARVQPAVTLRAE